MVEPINSQIEQYMNLLSARQKVVSSNIANADTPGYRTQDIDFQSEMEFAAGGMKAAVTDVRGLRVKNDGNNVSLDREARLLAENAMRFSMAANLVKGQLKTMKMAIEGGNGAA